MIKRATGSLEEDSLVPEWLKDGKDLSHKTVEDPSSTVEELYGNMEERPGVWRLSSEKLKWSGSSTQETMLNDHNILLGYNLLSHNLLR